MQWDAKWILQTLGWVPVILNPSPSKHTHTTMVFFKVCKFSFYCAVQTRLIKNYGTKIFIRVWPQSESWAKRTLKWWVHMQRPYVICALLLTHFSTNTFLKPFLTNTKPFFVCLQILWYISKKCLQYFSIIMLNLHKILTEFAEIEHFLSKSPETFELNGQNHFSA